MIKVGDCVTHDITGERFEITEYNDKYVWLRKENGFRDITTHETLYKWLYLEQKQRADRAEKRWSELREQMEHDEKEAFGEGDVIAYTVHNYVLELMEQLEEDGE